MFSCYASPFREDKKRLFQAGEAERELPFMDGFLVRNLEEMAYLKEQTPGAVLSPMQIFTPGIRRRGAS
ncbi:MAG: hypothetical protein ACLR6B_02240 [Blautia sp.]